MAEIKKYLDLEGLQKYDELAKARTSAEIDADVKVAKEALEQSIGTVAGDLATLDAEVVAEIVRAKAAEEANAAAAKAAQDDVDALEAKVGEVPEDKTVVQMIADAQTAATYDDTKVKEDIAANAKAIADETARAEGIEAGLREDVNENADAIAAINNETTGILAQAKAYADGKDEAIAAAKKAGDDAQAEVDALETVVDGKADKATTLAGYGIADAYTKTEADSAIAAAVANASHLKREIVEVLPTENIDANTIYMIAKETASTNQAYDEFMYINGAWEKIGDTEVDLTNYATKEYADQAEADALAAAKTYADGLDTAMDARVDALELAVGTGGAVEDRINNAIDALDADKTSAAVEEGRGVQVQVVEENGKITNVAVTGNFDNAYDAKGAAAAAQTAATNAAAEDATTKANAAQSAAETTAKNYTDAEIAKLDTTSSIATSDIEALFKSAE